VSCYGTRISAVPPVIEKPRSESGPTAVVDRPEGRGGPPTSKISPSPLDRLAQRLAIHPRRSLQEGRNWRLLPAPAGLLSLLPVGTGKFDSSQAVRRREPPWGLWRLLWMGPRGGPHGDQGEARGLHCPRRNCSRPRINLET
jgi:hypothetical protein